MSVLIRLRAHAQRWAQRLVAALVGCAALLRDQWAGLWPKAVPFGLRGERLAERFLRRLGYTIVDRRTRGGLGEIDLVAVDQRTIVFVEVKSRRSHHRGHPAEAVDPRKQRRLTRLALSWLKRHDLLNARARFDVIAVTWPKTERSPTIKHIRNAFEAAGDGQMFC